MNVDALCKVIHDEFAKTPVPKASEMVPKHEYVHLECDEIREAFEGKTRSELSIPFLTYHREAVFFFTPRAWSYYLPAYIQAVLNNYDETDTMVNALLVTLTPSPNVDDEVHRRARIASLIDRQRAAVGRFIDWVASEHPDDLDEGNRQATMVDIVNAGAGKTHGYDPG